LCSRSKRIQREYKGPYSQRYRKKRTKDKKDCIRALYPHIEDHLSKGFKLSYVTRHILGLFNGQPGSRLFRRHLSEQAFKKDASIQTIEDALAYMPD